MKDIPLTNHQWISFFLPGQLFVFSFFITYRQVNSIDTLLYSLKSLNIAFLIVSIIFSFIMGLIIDAIRNVFIEGVIFRIIEENKLKENRFNWDFFYLGEREEVGVFYARYYTYYCFDFNFILSLILSLITFYFSFLNCKFSLTIIVLVSAFFLWRDAVILRRDMIKATNAKSPK